MPVRKKDLYVKLSTLPGAGKGLFTKVPIAKGERIAEYKGENLTWKEVEKMADYRNGYVFYFSKRHVIDAWKTKKSLAHFANDAKGLARVEWIKNNSEYVIKGKRCFLQSIKNITANSELFASYGREYWQVIRYNIRIEKEKIRKEGKINNVVKLPHQLASKRQKVV